jgi:succinoglycan biosynthesis protein ExoM
MTDEPIRVDVCICTFRRPSIAETIDSLARQHLDRHVQIRIVVADNDTRPTARALVLKKAREQRLDVRYLHAPGRNISVARNACLNFAEGDWIAFLDDDETADPRWLASLLAKSADADVIFGPVQARYSEHAPSWVREGDFHSARVVYRNGRIETGYSGNVLMRRSAVEAANLRFDLECGVSGGEDTVFFGQLAAAGLRFTEAVEALASEPVAEGRATLKWLGHRALRSGQSYATMILTTSGASASLSKAVLAVGKASACVVGALASSGSALGWRRWALRGVLHAGAALRFAGIKRFA